MNIDKYKIDKGNHIIYYIYHNNDVIYIGRTTRKRLHRREYEHNYNLKKGDNKRLYKYLLSNNINEIKLIPIFYFNSKIKSKRFEAKLLLDNYFDNDFTMGTLKQTMISISDR